MKATTCNSPTNSDASVSLFSIRFNQSLYRLARTAHGHLHVFTNTLLDYAVKQRLPYAKGQQQLSLIINVEMQRFSSLIIKLFGVSM